LFREGAPQDLVLHPVDRIAPLRRAQRTSRQELRGFGWIEHSWEILLADAKELLTGGCQEFQIVPMDVGNCLAK
jgi:hypothetical protein